VVGPGRLSNGTGLECPAACSGQWCYKRHSHGINMMSTWRALRAGEEETSKWTGPVGTIFYLFIQIFSNQFKFEMVKDGILVLEKFQIKYGHV
jgi:hypothetical protein